MNVWQLNAWLIYARMQMRAIVACESTGGEARKIAADWLLDFENDCYIAKQAELAAGPDSRQHQQTTEKRPASEGIATGPVDQQTT